MSKAERRKRSRQRARERATTEQKAAAFTEEASTQVMSELAGAASPGEPLTSDAGTRAAYSGGRLEPLPEGAEQGARDVLSSYPPKQVIAPREAVDELLGQKPEALIAQFETAMSEFITGPITPAPQPRAPKRAEVRLIDGPVSLPAPGNSDAQEDDEDAEVEDAEDDEDEAPEDGGDDEQDGDEDDDGPEDDEDEAIFQVACAAEAQLRELAAGQNIESLTWGDVVSLLLIAPVEDPRLGLVAALLCDSDAPVHPKAIIDALENIGLGEAVTDAREAVTEEDGTEGDVGDVAIARTTSRELGAQSKRELTPQRAPAAKPVKASALRARQSALGTTVKTGGVA